MVKKGTRKRKAIQEFIGVKYQCPNCDRLIRVLVDESMKHDTLQELHNHAIKQLPSECPVCGDSSPAWDFVSWSVWVKEVEVWY